MEMVRMLKILITQYCLECIQTCETYETNLAQTTKKIKVEIQIKC